MQEEEEFESKQFLRGISPGNTGDAASRHILFRFGRFPEENGPNSASKSCLSI